MASALTETAERLKAANTPPGVTYMSDSVPDDVREEVDRLESMAKAITGEYDRFKESQRFHRAVRRCLTDPPKENEEIARHPSEIGILGHKAKVIRSQRLNRSLRAAVRDAGYGTIDMMELDPKDGGADLFHSVMEATREGNRYAAAVYIYPRDEYENMRLFVSEDGRCGYALKPADGGDVDIVSVFSMSQPPGATPTARDAAPNVERERKRPMGQALLLQAVANGGTILDCYDTVLPHIYASVGFKEESRDEWDYI